MIEQIKHNKFLLVISILIVILVVLLVSKITYAYLDKPESTPGITEGDIVSSGDKLIFTKGEDLALNLSTDNFNYETEGNITTSTNPKVTLIANSKTKDAKAKYSTGINITKNTFVSSDETPELILQVKCDNNEIKAINKLEYNEDLKGFDITNKKGIFNAAIDKEITSTDSTTGTTHNWEYTIILINKEIDQSINETAEFKAEAYIAEEAIIPIEDVLLADANKDNVITLYHHNAEDLTDPEMANSDKIANDDSYRFSGADTNVKNYVCLDSRTTGDCESDEDLYRIIGLFKNDLNLYEMKLIKAQGATTTQLGDSDTAAGGSYKGLYSADYSSYQSYYKGSNWETLAGYYWNRSNGTSSTNMWQYSNLNKINLNQFYYDYITTRATYLENHITEHTWTTGGTSNDSNVKSVYDSEPGDGKVKVEDNVCRSETNSSTAIQCTEEDIEYTDNIGLMYISDYMYGARPTYWSTSAGSYSSASSYNWLYSGMYEWTISRDSSDGYGARDVNVTGLATNFNVYSSGLGVRPSFYLTSDAKIKEGEGSKTKPYRITFE